MVEHVRDSPMINAVCVLSCDTVYGPFFFGGGGVVVEAVNRIIYPIMLMLWLTPQLLEDKPNVVFQHDGAPPYIHSEVKTFLTRQFPAVVWPRDPFPSLLNL
jgi:hypothetical protein